jgi:hypothetical protein
MEETRRAREHLEALMENGLRLPVELIGNRSRISGEPSHGVRGDSSKHIFLGDSWYEHPLKLWPIQEDWKKVLTENDWLGLIGKHTA